MTPRSERQRALRDAETKAEALFAEVEARELIQPGKTEKQLNTEMYELALEMFGIRKYWHKRIVRAGENTLSPYRENPPNLLLQEDEILFFDFGPVFEEWEADFGRTYVLGSDPKSSEFEIRLNKPGAMVLSTFIPTPSCQVLTSFATFPD